MANISIPHATRIKSNRIRITASSLLMSVIIRINMIVKLLVLVILLVT